MQQHLPLAHAVYIYELMIQLQGSGAIPIPKYTTYKNTAISVMVNGANLLSPQLSKCHSAKGK